MANTTAAPQKLFAVYLGGRAPRCNIELHDVIFVAGSNIESCYDQILRKWFGDPAKVHIDSWMELDYVDGYRISLGKKAGAFSKKLFFINLGAYLPDQFTELHANTFVVASNQNEVKKRAKGELLPGTQSLHTDDLYDIDDCLEISEVNGYRICLEPSPIRKPLKPHNGYYILPSEVVKSYLQKDGFPSLQR